MQLVYQDEQDVELTYGSKTRGDLPQPAPDFAGGPALELEHRNQFAHAPRRHARLVQRANVPFFDGVEYASEPIDAFSEQF